MFGYLHLFGCICHPHTKGNISVIATAPATRQHHAEGDILEKLNRKQNYNVVCMAWCLPLVKSNMCQISLFHSNNSL